MHHTTALLTAASFAQLATAGLYPGITPNNHTCQLQEPLLSCSDGADPNNVDTCCVETYGGLLLQTQFWSLYTGLEDEGQVLPKSSWSVHGLWPDFCNGSYTQYCDLSRQYDPSPSPNTTNGEPDGTPVPAYDGTPLDQLFEPHGKGDLLAWMNKYWIAQNQPNWEFWGHEFSKHATCYSTFQTECYGPKASKYDDLFDFYATVAAWFRILPTWGWLSAASIHPSNATAYSLSDIQGALVAGFGELPYVSCIGPAYNETDAGRGSADDGATQLSQIWYYHHTYGAAQLRQTRRVSANVTGGSVSNCAKADGAIWYHERVEGSEM